MKFVLLKALYNDSPTRKCSMHFGFFRQVRSCIIAGDCLKISRALVIAACPIQKVIVTDFEHRTGKAITQLLFSKPYRTLETDELGFAKLTFCSGDLHFLVTIGPARLLSFQINMMDDRVDEKHRIRYKYLSVHDIFIEGMNLIKPIACAKKLLMDLNLDKSTKGHHLMTEVTLVSDLLSENGLLSSWEVTFGPMEETVREEAKPKYPAAITVGTTFWDNMST
ncbi:hypothetical protein POM88_047502 [Heracleum sosnowskyi]|uniref:Uncharacterized protein n=1 Tax=Heracleum sosnowskyi TaxID=360622 RepID=A0AAD8GTD2_9APIA|nr:hypothetical protein POM88_047502 [Heracleum sosnowskyi]